MDAATQFVVNRLAGQELDLVVYDEGLTRVFRVNVNSSQPLVLSFSGDRKDALRSTRRVMVVAHADGISLRGEGHIDQVRWDGKEATLEIGNVNWEVLDRRRHPRHSVDFAVEMKLVMEFDDNAEIVTHTGQAIDLSLSGSCVKIAKAPHLGTLVNFNGTLNGKPFNALALVAHVGTDGSIGVHFVEFYGNSSADLSDYLKKQIAA